VSMVGVLAQTQVCHQHRCVTKVLAQLTQCPLHDAVSGVGLTPDTIFCGWNAKQNHPGDACIYGHVRCFPQRFQGVLVNNWHCFNGSGLVNAFFDKKREYQIGGRKPGFGERPSQCGSTPQPSRPLHRKPHA